MNRVYFFIAIILLTCPLVVYSQDSAENERYFEVAKVFPPFSVKSERLSTAKKLIDLNKHYTESWVKHYESVEIFTIRKGAVVVTKGMNDLITKAQRKAMLEADTGSKIDVKVKYLPDNQLNDDVIREINFTVSVDPDRDATYPGGDESMHKFLRENAIDFLQDSLFQGYKLTAVKFTIDEKGRIANAHIAWSSGDVPTDDQLVETINKMPLWEPAQYNDGRKVKQDFALMIGSKESCVVNLLQVNRNN